MVPSLFRAVPTLRLVAALILLGLPAAAAQTGAPGCPKTDMRLVVLGDSLADGLWGSLYRSFARCEKMDIVRLTEVSDGLAKSPAEDWVRRYQRAGARGPQTDVAIVQIGANDITTIRDGRSRVSFSTEDWNGLYSARVAALTRALEARAAEVIWVGLPVVGKANLEGPYRTISALQRRAVRAAGGAFVDIHQATTFGNGGFSMNGRFGGRLQQLRAPDQVHFTKAGYDFVAGQIHDDIARLIAHQNRQAALQDVEIQ